MTTLWKGGIIGGLAVGGLALAAWSWAPRPAMGHMHGDMEQMHGNMGEVMQHMTECHNTQAEPDTKTPGSRLPGVSS